MLLALLLSLSVQAQPAFESHETYWFLREKLLRRFVHVGEGAGRSIIVAFRNDTHLHFGDTTVNQGWYIGMLASEYAILKRENKPTDATLAELYYALKAAERLDYVAETFYVNKKTGKRGEPALNGFFVRDDATPDILRYFPGATEVSSNAQFDKHDKYLNQMSQDQLIHLLMGLNLVKELVDTDAQYAGQSIREMNLEMVKRLFAFVTKHDNKWHIKNPITGKKVNRGPNAGIMSLGLYKTFQNILGEKAIDHKKPAWYSGIFWKTVFRLAWVPRFYNRAMVSILASSGNVYREASVRVLDRYSKKYDRTFYPHLYGLTYDCPEKLHAETIESLMNEMPANPDIRLKGPRYWNSTNRHLQPMSDYKKRSNSWVRKVFGDEVQLNGIDYLILHNFYVLLYNHDYGKNFEPSEGYKELLFQQASTK